jgi:predicted DNA-binding WGR domain protein
LQHSGEARGYGRGEYRDTQSARANLFLRLLRKQKERRWQEMKKANAKKLLLKEYPVLDELAPVTEKQMKVLEKHIGKTQRVIRHDGDEHRFYEVDGEYYPSATTILDCYPMAWGLREFLQANSKAEAEQKKNDAAIQGSKIHHTIELLLSGRQVTPEGITDEQIGFLGLVDKKLVRYLKEPFSEREDVMLKGFMQFWEDYDVKMEKSEEVVFSKKWRYAGMLDFIGHITLKETKKRNAPPILKPTRILLDWKTGKGLYPDYDLQIAAYWNAHREMTKEKGKLAIGLLQLGVNKCGYKLKLVENPAKRFKEFLIIKSVWDMVNPDAKPREYTFAPTYAVKLTKLKAVKSSKK